MQLNTCTEKFLAAALGVMCHHYTTNQKHILYRNKLPISVLNYKRLWQTEGPVISTRNFPHDRLGSLLGTVQWSQQVKNRKPSPLGT